MAKISYSGSFDTKVLQVKADVAGPGPILRHNMPREYTTKLDAMRGYWEPLVLNRCQLCRRIGIAGDHGVSHVRISIARCNGSNWLAGPRPTVCAARSAGVLVRPPLGSERAAALADPRSPHKIRTP